MSITAKDKGPKLRNKRDETRWVKKCSEELNAKVRTLVTTFTEFIENNSDLEWQAQELERLNKAYQDWVKKEAKFNFAFAKDLFTMKVCEVLDKHNAIAEGRTLSDGL